MYIKNKTFITHELCFEGLEETDICQCQYIY